MTRVSLPKGQTHGFFFTPIGYLNKEQFDKVKELQNSPSMHDALTVEIDATPAQSSAPALPHIPAPPAPVAPTLNGRDKWLASATLPQAIKDWIVQVDDATALAYLTANYPNEV